VFEGLWWKADKFHKAGDGFLRSNVHNPQQQYYHARSLIMGGEISLVPIPGPNMIAGKSGILSPAIYSVPE